MNSEIMKTYRRLNHENRGGIVGESAKWALRDARTIVQFNDNDNVRIVAEPEEEDYFSAYGRESPEQDKRTEEIIERFGCWYVKGEYKCPICGNWETADGIGMCTGYNDPTSPYQNEYVPGIMRETLDQLAKACARIKA
jgi:hypothetical protein